MTNFAEARRSLRAAAFLCGTALAAAAQPALAQEAAAQLPEDQATDQADDAGAIVVTASRTAQNGLEAPTPTQVVGAATIERQAATTVMEVLNQNPAFKPTRSPGANGSNTSSPAQATADLRALGGQRTLVLVNGSRVVPFAAASTLGSPITTDLNLMPTLMIDRVDVVTGGASALYGSDAVSGVVNLIMKTKYDGVQVTAQGGVSQFGDFGNYRVGAIGGVNFANDRAHIVLSADYSNNEGVGDQYNRDWGRDEWNIVTNGQKASNGLTDLILSKHVRNSLGLGGVFLSGRTATGATVVVPALTNMYFNPDGSLRPFDKGAISGGQTMIGGEGTVITTGTDLVPAVRRFTTYGSLYADIADNWTAYIEGGYSESKGQLDGVPIRLPTQAIKRTNAYVPGAVLTALPATATSFVISRFATDLPNNQYNIYNKTPHGTVGFKGDLGASWKLDGHFSYGENHYSTDIYNNPVTARINNAVDAVKLGNGSIVCGINADASTANDDPSCVPINLFGAGNVSAAGFKYITTTGHLAVNYKQTTAGVNLVGQPFSTWAGPVAVAVGGEYRKESQVLTADPIASANGFLTAGNAVPWKGAFDVKEGYLEATVPLADGASFARKLDLNGAIRYADYSTAGGQTAWKVGAVWEPFDGFNLRAARSRDIRAPALNELYSPGSNVTNAVTVKVDGVLKTASIPQNASLGNPALNPEYGDTWTAGFAYRGHGGLSGLGLSLDYYNIKIKGAITNLSSVNIANLCTGGDQYFCNFFTYGPDASTADPNDRIHTGLVAPALNVGAFRQEGIDGTLSYNTGVGFMGDGGRYSVAGSGTYIFHAIVDSGTGAAPIDRAGENNQINLGAIPTFRGNITQTLGNNNFEVSLQTLYVAKGTLDNTYNTPGNQTINDNRVPAVWYFNLFGKLFADEKKYELFWAVNNLFDKDPPPTPYAILNTPTNGQYYDKVGRNFVIGARMKF